MTHFIWLGWIPGFLGFRNTVNEIWIWVSQILELEKSLKMIPILNRFPGNWKSILNFCVGAWVGEHLATKYSRRSKDAHENSTSFDTNLQGAKRRGKAQWRKNDSKNGFYGGWNYVGWHKSNECPLFYIWNWLA